MSSILTLRCDLIWDFYSNDIDKTMRGSKTNGSTLCSILKNVSKHFTLRELALEMLQRAEAVQLACHHDSKPRAQRFAFLHAVRRKYHASPGSYGLAYRRPYESLRSRVHAYDTLLCYKAMCGLRGLPCGLRAPSLSQTILKTRTPQQLTTLCVRSLRINIRLGATLQCLFHG